MGFAPGIRPEFHSITVNSLTMRPSLREIEQIEALEAGEVQKAAASYLRRDRRCIVIGKPQ